MKYSTGNTVQQIEYNFNLLDIHDAEAQSLVDTVRGGIEGMITPLLDLVRRQKLSLKNRPIKALTSNE